MATSPPEFKESGDNLSQRFELPRSSTPLSVIKFPKTIVNASLRTSASTAVGEDPLRCAYRGVDPEEHSKRCRGIALNIIHHLSLFWQVGADTP
ncbi:hypothetical protein TNCT_67611 [Trichonephila clavata]|uniref:Uncharacterized protein n=1 Tax=Trichonephila clavata TaxID=2740835 RepID=A0A8X6FZ89_TRICU|nr:hypothetical protein TNCT_67611 [Trichonephila clavata]